MSQLKIKNGNEWVDIPAGGVGVPSGGSAGDVLIKSSSTDYATEWGKRFSVTTLLLHGNVTQNSQSFTLADSVENYDLLCVRMNVNATTGGASTTIVPTSLLSINGIQISYFGTSVYWASNAITFSGTTAASGTSQKSEYVTSAYLSIYGLKLA